MRPAEAWTSTNTFPAVREHAPAQLAPSRPALGMGRARRGASASKADGTDGAASQLSLRTKEGVQESSAGRSVVACGCAWAA